MIMKGKIFISLFLAGFLLLVSFPAQGAEKTIRIGAIWPLSGPVSREGQEARVAVELAKDIINNKTNLKGIPLAQTEGLPNLGGAKIEIIWGDTQGKPEIGRAETERLITVEKVVAIIGCYQSAVAIAAIPVAERYGIPFVVADAINPDICKKGYKVVFRTTPINTAYVKNAHDMIDEFQKEFGTKYERCVFSHDTSFQGNDFAKAGTEQALARGYKVIGAVATQEGVTDVTSDVLKIKSMQPEILLLHHYSGNAILLQKAFAKYRVDAKVFMAYPDSYNLSDFLNATGSDSDYIFSPGIFPPRLVETQPKMQQVNEMFKQRVKRTGQDLRMSDVGARDLQALLVLGEAINRARSTDPQAVIKALSETDLSQDQVIVPWKGVKFDSTGENIRASAVIQQRVKGRHEIVWPLNMRSTKPIWPAPSWEERLQKGE
jgi:branched-chain amino acid transport system substrate-binding protein